MVKNGSPYDREHNLFTYESYFASYCAIVLCARHKNMPITNYLITSYRISREVLWTLNLIPMGLLLRTRQVTILSMILKGRLMLLLIGIVPLANL